MATPQNELQEESVFLSPRRLIWLRFKKHRFALVGLIVLVLLYFFAIFADFFVPYGSVQRFSEFSYVPPSRVRFFHEGKLHRPFIYGTKKERNSYTYRFEFSENKEEIHPIRFFVQGEPYKLLFFIPFRTRLIGTEDHPLFLFGTDQLGRDVFSRVFYGARVSLFIGLAGVMLSFALGCFFGGISGYFGGVTDEVIQRIIDLIMSIPQIPLWMALSAAVPRDWDVIKTYFAITLVLASVGWAPLARVVRGKLLALREEEFALAAKAAGAREIRIITRHLLPAFFSYLIVSVSLAIPRMILGETALSFLGLGMQPPAVSWGVLLQNAQEIAAIAHHSWLLIPVIFVIITVLMYNFVGDGLRDAADPYSK